MRKEQFKKILNHQQPKYPIVDLGGCPQAWLSPEAECKICDFLGFKKSKNDTPSISSIDERILNYYKTDTRGIGYILTPKNSHYKKIDEITYIDEWGIMRKFTGLYWDIISSPLKDKSKEYIKNYPFPKPCSIDKNELKNISEKAKKLHNETDFIICASHPVYGIFELGCWMFGFEDFLYRMAAEPDVIHMFFERVLQYQKEVSALYYKDLKGYIDFTSSGDDFATQYSTFVSVSMFNELIKPYFKERITYTRKIADTKFLHHSCGKIFNLIPSLIDCGVDIINPIQPVDNLMSAENLKKVYGNDIVFHGGFDTQELLLSKDLNLIKKGVYELLDVMNKDGGYIFATSHIIQSDVPAENINALFEATKQYKKQI